MNKRSAIKTSSWRCSGLLPGFSPVLDRTETILGGIFSTFASLSELSLEALPPREFTLGFGTMKASFWRCSDYRGSLQYSIVQTLSLEKYFPPSPAFRSCLWKRFPPESSLSGSLPSRHSWRCSGLLPGACPVFDRTETILGKKYFPPSPTFQSLSLEALLPRELSLGFGTIKASSWCCSGLLPGSPQYSIVQKLFLGKSFSPPPAFQSLSLEALPPRELSLGFGTIKASSWRCSALLQGVTPVFDRTETTLEDFFSHFRRPSRAVSGSASPP